MHTTRPRAIALLLGAALLAAAAPARAGVRYFTNFTSWVNAVGSTQDLMHQTDHDSFWGAQLAGGQSNYIDLDPNDGLTSYIGLGRSGHVNAQVPQHCVPAAGGLAQGAFRLRTLEPGAQWVWGDQEPGGGGFGLVSTLSVGDINNWENDDFRIEYDGYYAVGFWFHDSTSASSESLVVRNDAGAVIATIGGSSIPSSNSGSFSTQFVGFVATEPIASVTFDEGAGGDDIAIMDLVFACSNGDADDDGLTDLEEEAGPTGKFDPDSDDDGLDDGGEIAEGTDPLDDDSDADGLLDGEEVLTHGTDPLDGDSDDDGVLDGEEVLTHGTDPLDADTDGDGLDDFAEIFTLGTNPTLADTDGDGVSDPDEIANGTDPTHPESDCYDQTDAEIFAKIDTLRPLAEAIVIDGDSADWAGIPSYSDPAADHLGEPDTEILDGAIAPLADRVKLLAHTAGYPGAYPDVVAVLLDVVGDPLPDVAILPTLNVATPMDASGVVDLATLGGIASTYAYGPSHVEFEVSYAALEPFAPGASSPRNWVRGWVVMLEGVRSVPVQVDGDVVYLDRGPGATSYLLADTPFALDPPLPATPNAPLPLRPPVQGRWFVGQGPFGAFSHAGGFAYDLMRVDGSFSRSSPPGSASNADYFSWEQTVVAPVPGIVTTVVSDESDLPPGVPQNEPANLVEIDAGSGLSVNLLHLRQGSVGPGVGQAVAEEEALGQVGNSGYTAEPHVHLEVNDAGVPLGVSDRGALFRYVEVSLNPVEDDPWARRCATWEPREGFLVKAVKVPACDDGVDNDNDGFVDFDGGGVGPGDPECSSPQGKREIDDACGLGSELVLLLPLIWRRRRATRR